MFCIQLRNISPTFRPWTTYFAIYLHNSLWHFFTRGRRGKDSSAWWWISHHPEVCYCAKTFAFTPKKGEWLQLCRLYNTLFISSFFVRRESPIEGTTIIATSCGDVFTSPSNIFSMDGSVWCTGETLGGVLTPKVYPQTPWRHTPKCYSTQTNIHPEHTLIDIIGKRKTIPGGIFWLLHFHFSQALCVFISPKFLPPWLWGFPLSRPVNMRVVCLTKFSLILIAGGKIYK